MEGRANAGRAVIGEKKEEIGVSLALTPAPLPGI